MGGISTTFTLKTGVMYFGKLVIAIICVVVKAAHDPFHFFPSGFGLLVLGVCTMQLWIHQERQRQGIR